MKAWTKFDATDEGHPQLRIGTSDAEELQIRVVLDTGAKTLDYILFKTDVASGIADKGQFKFNVDGTEVFRIDDGGIEIVGDITGTSLSVTGDLVAGSAVPRITLKGGTDDDGIVFGSLGTATKGIDLSGSGLSGNDFLWYYSSLNSFTANGKMLVSTFVKTPKLYGITFLELLTTDNGDIIISPDGFGNTINDLTSSSSFLAGNKTPVGSITDATSNGTATIVKTTHGLSLAAGDVAHITDTAESGDKGFYRVVSDDGSNIVVDRALTGSLTDVDITFYKDLIGFFATDGANGQRIMGYSHQDKPLQIGGDVLVATSHSLGAEDVLIGGSKFEVNPDAYFVKSILLSINKLIRFNTNGPPEIGANNTGGQSNTLVANLGSDKAFVISATANVDWGHGVMTNPTLFVHSSTTPGATDEWISFQHNVTDAVINWGSGNLSLAGPNGVDVVNDLVAGTMLSDDYIAVAATKKILFDGLAGHTYWTESADDVFSIFVGGVEGIRLVEDTWGCSLHTPEITTPTAISGWGSWYTKSDDIPYFQDGSGVEHVIVTSDYAGVGMDTSTGFTIDLTDLFHKFELFDHDTPEVISNGVFGSDHIVVGATAVYCVMINSSLSTAVASKEFVGRVFSIGAALGGEIASITQATPGIVETDSAHGLSNGNKVKLTGNSMVEAMDKLFIVADVTSTTFKLKDDEGVDVNTGGYAGSDANGTVHLATETSAHWHRNVSGTAIGNVSGHDILSLTKDETIEYYIKNKTDGNNATFDTTHMTIVRL